MKYFVLLTLCAVAVAASVIPVAERVNGENGWYVPQINGSFEWMDLDEAKAVLTQGEARWFINPVTFILYTASNPNVGYEITASKESIDASPFNAKNPTRITIHGWTSSRLDPLNTGVRDAYLKQGDCNMITVEWLRSLSIEYISSVIAVPGVGEKVAALVDSLVKNNNLHLKDLEIIGHSLGAHIAGFTGKNMASGKPRTIVGLDPALPLYNFDIPDSRLSATDADYVESIQTNGGKLGFSKPIGKGAFYPAGGKLQPACGIDLTGSCSHNLATTYYIEAIEEDNFATVKCEDYTAALASECGTDHSTVRMGAVTNDDQVAGDYYVPVNKAAPFGKLV